MSEELTTETKLQIFADEIERLRAENDRLYARIREILASPPAGISNAVASKVEDHA